MADSDYRVTAIRLQNFMAFEDTDWIELRPITLLFGRNSSGKSAIIRALLLLKQSIESKEGVAPLALSGPPVDFGSFYSLIHDHQVKQDVTFSFRVEREPGPPRPFVTASEEEVRTYEMAMEQREKERVAWTKEANINGDRIELALSFGLIGESEEGRPDVANGRPGLKRIQVSGYPRSVDTEPVPVFTAEYQLAERGWGRPSVFSETLTDFRFGDRSLRPFEHEIWDGVTFELYSGLFPLLSAETPATARLEDLPRDWQTISVALNFLRERIVATLDRIIYMPPLRDAPKRYYAADTLWVRDLLDEPGQFHRDAVNWWLASASLNAQVEVTHLNDEEGIAAVYMKEGRKDGEEIRVNLRDVGSGVAQVLPVIVGTMTAGLDGLVIVEQPELHLHPDAQAALADFFIALSKPGVGPRFLLETHSSSLIYRLRRRVAETTAGWIEEVPQLRLTPHELSAHFVYRVNETSVCKSITFKPNGDYAQQPEGFIDFFGTDYEQLYRLRDAQVEMESPSNDLNIPPQISE